MTVFRSLLFALVVTIWTQPAPVQSGETARKPNIIFILTDDQGYGDLSCHGNPVLNTPNIDALHARSVRFVDYQASPTCAPTRSALMTGRHEFKNGITHTIMERERMNLRAYTLAQLLKSAGYATGIFGKWHLGDEPPYQPEKRGFDLAFTHGAGGIGQTYPKTSCGDAPNNSYFNPVIRENGVFVKTKGYCTDVFFERALHWVDQRRREPAPFLCWIATNAPHGPLICPPDYEKQYTGKVQPNVAKFFGMIANIDDNVGRLVAKMKEWGLEKDTIVIFMTDNGGTAGVQLFNAGMRANKGTPYWGGVRVPFFVSGEGRFPRGVDVRAVAAQVDVFPTFAELTGAKIPDNIRLDGRSLVPLLKDANAPWADRTLFHHVGRWAKGEAAQSKYALCAVRTAQYRLVSGTKKGPAWELFDMRKDSGEKNDLSKELPEVVRDLASRYDRWWDEVTPDLINENVVSPPYNAYHVLYWKQFGGGPKDLE